MCNRRQRGIIFAHAQLKEQITRKSTKNEKKKKINHVQIFETENITEMRNGGLQLT